MNGDTGGLTLRGVSKRWPGAPTPALDGVNLDVAPGQVAVIEGENGAGKTTLLRIVGGVVGADSGEVRLRGRTPNEDRVAYQRDLGIVSAGDTGLYNRLNSLQHLQFAARLALVDRPSRASRVREMFERFQLFDFGGRRVDRLSMGQRQRLRLAMAFVAGPPLLLLDEPATSLDGRGAEALTEALAEGASAGQSAVWLCPSGAEVPFTPARHWVLSDGQLTE